MAQLIDEILIDSLSAQSLGSVHWLQRARFAAELIYGAQAIALICRVPEGAFSLAGLVNREGVLTLEPPEQLEYPHNGDPLPALYSVELDEQQLGEGQLSNFDLNSKTALLLPWPLGLNTKFAFVLFDVKIDRNQKP